MEPALTHEHELNATTSGSVRITSGSDTLIQGAVAYSYLAEDPIQLTAVLNVAFQGGNSSIAPLVGPTLNIPIDKKRMDSAIYVSVLGGLDILTISSISQSDFAYRFAVGKRFGVTDDVCWRPEARVDGIAASGSRPVFRLIPVQFSFFF